LTRARNDTIDRVVAAAVEDVRTEIIAAGIGRESALIALERIAAEGFVLARPGGSPVALARLNYCIAVRVAALRHEAEPPSDCQPEAQP
jgi:hypothetical protein